MSADAIFDEVAHLRRLGRFADAASRLRAALAEVPDDRGLLIELGHSCRLQGDFEEAQTAYADAMAYAEMEEDAEDYLDALLGLAATWRGMGRLDQALVLIEEAHEIVDALDDEASRPFLAWLEGGLHRFRGDLARALAVLRQGLAKARALSDREGEGYLLAALGGALRTAGDESASAEIYAEAYDVFREVDDAFGLAYTACGRGNAARLRGDLRTAAGFFREAADRYRVFGDRVSYAYTLWAWATLCKLEGRWQDAAPLLDEAAALFESTADRRGAGYVRLARIEIAALSGAAPALAMADDARTESAALAAAGYPLEAAYGELLAGLLAGQDTAAAFDRLAALGTGWRAGSLPLNIP